MEKQPVVPAENLRPSEIRLIAAMQQLGYGCFESLHIHAGEFELKKQVVEFLGHVRTINDCVIRILEIRGGLPSSMEILVGRSLRTGGSNPT